VKTKFKSEEEKRAYAIAIICNSWNEPIDMLNGKLYTFPKPRYEKISQSQLDAIISGFNMDTEEAKQKINELIDKP
jgi:hypothetical protein